jgi:hypothetical protein
LTHPRPPDLRDLLRAALIETETRAAERRLPCSAFRFGDVSIAMRLDGTQALQRLMPMIGSRADDAARDTAMLDVIGSLDGHEGLLPPPHLRSRTVLRASRDIYYLWRDEADGYLTAIDRRVRRGLVWFTAAERIASWHVARPFLHAIKGFSLEAAWTPIHAASVARDGKAVLIVGQSGAGKTSIALSLVTQGWSYLGDDAVIVRANPARVGALYSSARLRADTFARFPEIMKACLAISDDAGEQKAEVDMTLLPIRSAAEADIRAILFPQPGDWSELRLAPVPKSDALRRMMEATSQSMMGDEAAVFAKLSDLVASVPCYRMAACGDPATLSSGLAKLLDGGGA